MSKTITIDGRPVPVTRAARAAGLAYSTLARRLARAVDESAVRRALAEPPMSREQAGRLGKASSPWRGR